MTLLFIQLIDIYTLVLLVAVIMSWIRVSPYHPVAQLIHALTEPVLSPARRIIPPMGGLDISPLLVFMGLRILRSVLIQSI